MPDYIVAVDVGTSALKAALFAGGVTLIRSCSREYPVYRPHEGWAEQDPADWWAAACGAIGELVESSGVEPREIACVGVAGQSWSCVPVGAEGGALARTPIWMDTRAQDICADVAGDIGEEAIFSVSGNPFMPSYTTPKALWFKANMGEVYKSARYFLQSNSYIVYMLTGVFSQDLSQGYGLHFFNCANKAYDAGLAGSIGLDVSKFPDLYGCHEVVGRVTPSASRLTGLMEGTPVVAGGLDAACGTLGAGVYAAGQTQEQGGQAGGMSICMDTPTAVKSLILSPHVVPDTWLLQGGTVGGAGSLRWFVDEFCGVDALAAEVMGTNVYDLVCEDAGRVPPGAEGVVFLPYMAGERSPIWNPDAAGVFYGLSFARSRADLIRAVLESSAYSLRHNIEVAEEAGVSIGAMHSMGGAANSRIWTQIKSDVTKKRIVVPGTDSATVLGASLIAAVGVGLLKGFEEAVAASVRVEREHQPDGGNFAAYDAGYKKYRRIYELLSPMMTGEGREI